MNNISGFQADETTFGISSNSLYIDNIGNIYAYDSQDGNLANLCNPSCDAVVTVQNSPTEEALIE